MALSTSPPCTRRLFGNGENNAANAHFEGDHLKVAIIHHDDMQLHIPPRYQEIYEVPRRIIAIENRLKGLDLKVGFPPEGNFGGRMQLLPASPAKTKQLVFGSPAVKKRRRSSYSSGPPEEGSAWEACRAVEAPLVEDSDILLVHSKRHLEEVTEACSLARSASAAFQPLSPGVKLQRNLQESVDNDLYYSPDSLVAFKRAAGGAIEAVRQLFCIDRISGLASRRSQVRSSFAIVRPPGHHCCCNKLLAFVFNNSAIAAAHARKVLGIPRVAILDWDYHHGDGTQRVFYQDADVLTISVHVALTSDGLAFPCKKDMDFTCNGHLKGRGYNINIPWPHDAIGLIEYTEAFQTIVIPAIQAFQPGLLLIASGFDAVAGDTLAGTCLQAYDFYNLTQQLLTSNLPIAVILEGGYSPSLLAEASINVVHALLGRDPPPQKSTSPNAIAKVARTGGGPGCNIKARCVLDAIRRRLNTLPPWATMKSPGHDRYFQEDEDQSASSKDGAARLSTLIEELASDH
uniref:histone deacetylase n=1 Tax=Karlodinium veneficum TaxID=407301 RepID=G0WKS7_KARVE|nr:putative histone deacetylase superfamily protein [Karlodinium veneficum]